MHWWQARGGRGLPGTHRVCFVSEGGSGSPAMCDGLEAGPSSVQTCCPSPMGSQAALTRVKTPHCYCFLISCGNCDDNVAH